MEQLKQPNYEEIKQNPLVANQMVIYSVMSILFVMVCTIAFYHNQSQENQLRLKDEIIKKKDEIIDKKDQQIIRMIEIDRIEKTIKKDSI